MTVLFNITGVGDTTFSYVVPLQPDVQTYNSTNSDTSFETTSTTASGPITRVTMLDNGPNYEVMPGIITITTDNGAGTS